MFWIDAKEYPGRVTFHQIKTLMGVTRNEDLPRRMRVMENFRSVNLPPGSRRPKPHLFRYGTKSRSTAVTHYHVEITLELISGSGYKWIMTNQNLENESPALELLNAGQLEVIPEGYDIPGGRMYYRWRYRAVSPGTETFDGFLTLGRCSVHGAGRFILHVNVISAQDPTPLRFCRTAGQPKSIGSRTNRTV
jgi:predicted secreted protein